MLKNTPQVVPLQVPWQISPSTPELSLATNVVDGNPYAVVTFAGFLGRETTLAKMYGSHARVVVVLEPAVFAVFYPAFSQEDEQRLNNYDWSRIPEFRDETGSLKGSIERFHCQWNETDVCPRPSAYRVVESSRLTSLGFQAGQFEHFLFIGEDFNIELIAKTMRWEIHNLRSSPS